MLLCITVRGKQEPVKYAASCKALSLRNALSPMGRVSLVSSACHISQASKLNVTCRANPSLHLSYLGKDQEANPIHQIALQEDLLIREEQNVLKAVWWVGDKSSCFN